MGFPSRTAQRCLPPADRVGRRGLSEITGGLGGEIHRRGGLGYEHGVGAGAEGAAGERQAEAQWPGEVSSGVSLFITWGSPPPISGSSPGAGLGGSAPPMGILKLSKSHL